MAESSTESVIMTLLEQVRCLEDERDEAIELSKSLNEKLRAKQDISKSNVPCKSSNELDLSETLEILANELEGIRLNEEQRQFNLSELSKEKDDKEKEGKKESKGKGANESKMVELCKQYYGKMVAELQEERKRLQQKVEKLQNELVEKDMKIAELQLNQA